MSKARQLAQKPSQPTGRKNIIINGGMTVDQRNETKTSSGFSVDRVYVNFGTVTAALSAVQSTEAPAGFANSLKIACTTADTSLGVSEAVNPQWRIEGQDLQQLQKGSSGARPVTLSFWVRSSKTGTYVFELKDQDNTRNISKAFTVDTADTWEKKEIVYEGDTTGAFDNDNNNSLSLILWMVAGTTYSSGTLQTSWGAQTQANRAVGVVNFVDSTSNDFYITGVQLEVGSTATEFEHRSFNEELRLCQRYYQLTGGAGGAANSSLIDCSPVLSPKMRAAASVSVKNGTGGVVGLNKAVANATSVNNVWQSGDGNYFGLRLNTNYTNLVSGQVTWVFGKTLAADAEL